MSPPSLHRLSLSMSFDLGGGLISKRSRTATRLDEYLKISMLNDVEVSIPGAITPKSSVEDATLWQGC